MLGYLKESFNSTLQEKSIPSLDGLRAISVAMVIGGHYFLTRNSGAWTKFFIYHELGVSLFFVISGFLITSILIKELDKTGTISFTRFLLKRVFRIFPAYYFYLIFWLFISSFMGIAIPSTDFISCFLYFGYYYTYKLNGLLSHTWSLAIEEQFYILWPPLVKLIKNRKSIYIFIISLLFLGPISRVLTYFFIPIYQHKYPFLLHTRIDTLMYGCLLAFALKDGLFQKLLDIFKKKWFFYLSVAYLLIVYPALHYFFLGKFRAPLGFTLEGFFIVAIIVHVISQTNTTYFRVLNNPVMRHLGVISYSIYLWQQPFVYISRGPLFKFPINILMIYIAALTSYLLVEYPLMKLRKRIL